jgi:hypothetical protein
MNFLRRIVNLVRSPKPEPEPESKAYAIVPSKDSSDLCIEHVSGVVIRIEEDGRVTVSSPSSLSLHAEGDLEISSNTHIGLVAPRIDLN